MEVFGFMILLLAVCFTAFLVFAVIYEWIKSNK